MALQFSSPVRERVVHSLDPSLPIIAIAHTGPMQAASPSRLAGPPLSWLHSACLRRIAC